ncbi:MAG TPA: EAL domain-containing protein [Methylococcaceae bacterium]|nr:EAL domain-containing protein [Methylococcaceae bacterium]
MLISSDKAHVIPILNSIGAYVYLVDVLEEGAFRYFAINRWIEEEPAFRDIAPNVGKRPEEFLDPDHGARLNRLYRQCVEARSHIEFEGCRETPEGTRWVTHHLAPLFDLTGRVVRIMGTIVDITERKRAERALEESRRHYQALYNEIPARLTMLDLDGVVLSINEFGARYFGYSPGEIVGRPVFDFLHIDDRKAARRILQDIRRSPAQLHRIELRILKKNGDIVWVLSTARLARDVDDGPVILVADEDITESHQLSDRLFYQATHDPLTGMINRRELERRLEMLLDHAREHDAQHAFAYLDLDQFKLINDTCGHGAGDELLRQMGRLLEGHIPDKDTLGRLGGDEFGLLLQDTTLEQAEKSCHVLRQAVQRYDFLWENRHFNVGVSIGVVAITRYSGAVTDVLKAADSASFAAKESGRNRIHVYREDDEELATRQLDMEWTHRIQRAIRENRLQLYRQRIESISGDDDGGDHYELLLRLQDEAGRLVSYGEFAAAVERYNLATRLDEWVIATAFHWLTVQPERLGTLGLCCINLSGISIGKPEFLDFIIAGFKETGLPPDKICFEITETAAIGNLSRATDFIDALRRLGCRFALDDFGTGVSSLAYLKNFPVDYLKIDGTFVRDIADDPIDLAVVESINTIGHVMGKKTVAEYVHREDVLTKLREIGVDYVQGFHIGRPEPLQ